MISPLPLHRRRQPLLGLLLTLLLYVGCGAMAAGHLHEDAHSVDHNCATCLLSAQTVAAVDTGAAHIDLVLAPVPLEAQPTLRAVSPLAQPRARAPPVFLI